MNKLPIPLDKLLGRLETEDILLVLLLFLLYRETKNEDFLITLLIMLLL